ncbi:MAG: hypothetical protein BWY58_00117 [Chloroflexi bacterium ADurb.Bin344]|nr:MAG: hypothetical protein BWY58_00117 [Chloroflexi bacterium ADurb.Bin344]
MIGLTVNIHQQPADFPQQINVHTAAIDPCRAAAAGPNIAAQEDLIAVRIFGQIFPFQYFPNRLPILVRPENRFDNRPIRPFTDKSRIGLPADNR